MKIGERVENMQSVQGIRIPGFPVHYVRFER